MVGSPPGREGYLLPVAAGVSALAALVALTSLFVGLAAFETIFSTTRRAVREN